MIDVSTFVPQKPFPSYKWRWASLQCTENINDPLVLLGVLARMRKLEGEAKYSSASFGNELKDLERELRQSNINLNLAERVGERNIVRNSGQYWKALGLIDDETRGEIKLTNFGRDVADRDISIDEFSAIIIDSLTLPNPHIQKTAECMEWYKADLKIHPLRLILDIICSLYSRSKNEAYMTRFELCSIVIPLAGTKLAEIDDYANFIQAYRKGRLNLAGWPDCCEGANDKRIAREFLLFLKFYGYLEEASDGSNDNRRFRLNEYILPEIRALLGRPVIEPLQDEETIVHKVADIADEVQRKKQLRAVTERPDQGSFRKKILNEFNTKCLISGVEIDRVLEAAHIVPVARNGSDAIGNGLCLRVDLHRLFDATELVIYPDGSLKTSKRVKVQYNYSLPQRVLIPPFVNKENLKWRLNYYGI